jgi:hypothetical protein
MYQYFHKQSLLLLLFQTHKQIQIIPNKTITNQLFPNKAFKIKFLCSNPKFNNNSHYNNNNHILNNSSNHL